MSDGLAVIGAGFGRTGTVSLKSALETLGFSKCYHMDEVFASDGHTQRWLDLAVRGNGDWQSIFDGYRAVLDWPACNYWRQLKAAYPKAKVLLSERNPDDWYRSLMKTIYPATKNARDSGIQSVALAGELMFAQIWDGVFKGRIEDKDFAINVFMKHNETVKNDVPEQDLIVFQPGDGWEVLCEKLSVPVPDSEFPHLNTTQWFWKTMMYRLSKVFVKQHANHYKEQRGECNANQHKK